MRRMVLALGSMALALAAWTACVGDDPSASSNQGAQDQPCYANGTCLAGLTCQSGRCTTANGDGGAQTSTSSSGATTDGGSCAAAPLTEGPHCGASPVPCPRSEACCAATTAEYACAPGTACTTADKWECEDNSQCTADGGSGNCCIDAVPRDPGAGDACGVPVLTKATSACVSSPTQCRGLTSGRPCRTADDCIGAAVKKCVVHNVETSAGSRLAIGICEANK